MHQRGGKCIEYPLNEKSELTLFVYRPLGWAYPPEIIPLYIRSKSVSLATFFNWACNFALTFFTPPGFQNIQWKVGLVCSIEAKSAVDNSSDILCFWNILHSCRSPRLLVVSRNLRKITGGD